MNRTHRERAVATIQRAMSEASGVARKAERKWWAQQLAKLIADAEELHGPGALVSASQLVRLVEKRGGQEQ